MENKYYTPNLEDFHVGFEYEVKEEKTFEKVVFKITDIYNYPLINTILNLQEKVEDSYIRVKYLDREDIESLGWSYNEEFKYFRIREDFILLEYQNNEILIQEDGENLFWGKIKNKSELKKLMKQIGIL